LLYLLLIAVGIYCLMCALLYVFQDKLIFFPPQPVADIYSLMKQNEISYVSQYKNYRINGWEIDINEKADKTVIYFGGNAEDVVYFNIEAEKLNVRQVFVFNHPGYGKSEGQPSEKSLYQSALDAYDFLIEQKKINPQKVVVIGRSMGSSVAAYLAANRDVSGVVLITPFDSISHIAAARFKYFPVKVILNHSFHTAEHIRKIDKPTLILAAEQDEMIAEAHLKNLIEASSSNSKIVKFPELGHNTIQTHADYYNELNRFINRL